MSTPAPVEAQENADVKTSKASLPLPSAETEAGDAQPQHSTTADTTSTSAPTTTTTTTTDAPQSDTVNGDAAQESNQVMRFAEGLLAQLKPFLSEQHVEVEARLCNFSAPQLSSGASSASTPQILRGPYGRIQVGVSADDFSRMRGFVESTKKLPTHQTQTEDVITREGRYTYAIAEDGTESFAGVMEKKRLCNVEVFVPNCPYDIRLSISTEVPRGATGQAAPAVKPHGFVRQKRRWTATEGTFEYAFTRVGGPAEKKATYEVELEGVHVNAAAGVTEEWLAELMDRLLALAHLEGNTGLPKNTYPDHRGGKRPRRNE